MKNYIGTKRLKATPMNLGDYNQKRGWSIPDNEDPLREGYFVEYENGYQSWSPKEVFEDSYVLECTEWIYKECDAPHQQRVIDESRELNQKCVALNNFITTNAIFNNLMPEEQRRLKLQLTTMMCYNSILIERIDNF